VEIVNAYKALVCKPKSNRSLIDLDIAGGYSCDVRERNRTRLCGLDSAGPEYDILAERCEYDNESSVFVNYRQEIRGQLSEYQLPRMTVLLKGFFFGEVIVRNG
jgi:hypothetical protein